MHPNGAVVIPPVGIGSITSIGVDIPGIGAKLQEANAKVIVNNKDFIYILSCILNIYCVQLNLVNLNSVFAYFERGRQKKGAL